MWGCCRPGCGCSSLADVAADPAAIPPRQAVGGGSTCWRDDPRRGRTRRELLNSLPAEAKFAVVRSPNSWEQTAWPPPMLARGVGSRPHALGWVGGYRAGLGGLRRGGRRLLVSSSSGRAARRHDGGLPREEKRAPRGAAGIFPTYCGTRPGRGRRRCRRRCRGDRNPAAVIRLRVRRGQWAAIRHRLGDGVARRRPDRPRNARARRSHAPLGVGPPRRRIGNGVGWIGRGRWSRCGWWDGWW
jgi:hypothetical protein